MALRTALGLLAAAAAVAAAFAPGSPTGVHVVDVVMKAAVAASCVLVGRRVPWPFIALAAVVVAVGSVSSVGFVVAVAILGLALAGWRASGADDGLDQGSAVTLLRAGSCGVIAELALRLIWPHVNLLPSLLGTAAVLLLLVPGVARLERRPRRIVLWCACVVAVVALGSTALAGFSALQARSEISAGITQVKRGLAAARNGRQSEALLTFSRAQHDFASASSDLNLAKPAEVIPVVSPQVRALRAAASIADDIATAGLRTASSTNVKALQIVHGVVPLQELARLTPFFEEDVRVLDQSLQHTASFRSPWLVGPLKDKLTTELGTLHQAQADAVTALLAAERVPGMLGADGPRRYLVLFVNPAESRASGGVVGDYAIVTAAGGKLSLGVVGSVAQLDRGGNPAQRHLVGPADYIARYSQFEPQYNWENVPLSPDFPSVANVAANLYPQSGGTHVDGVISVDPVAMASLLAMTGPIVVKHWAGQIDSKNVVSILGHQEFVVFGSDYNARVHFVQSVIKAVWHKLIKHKLPLPPEMALDVRAAIKGGHLLVWSTSSSDERLLQRADLSGSMPAVNGDFVGVVTQNAAGNKIDWYLRRSIAYDAHVNLDTDRINATLTVTLHNSSPTSGLPPIVIDPVGGVAVTPGESELYMSLYSPWQETSATLDGKPLNLTEQRELGRLVYSSLVTVPAGGSTTVVLHLSGRWPSRDRRYHLGWFHQPVLFPDSVTSKVTMTG